MSVKRLYNLLDVEREFKHLKKRVSYLYTQLGVGGSSVYTTDGTLSGNRFVDLNGNDISFISGSTLFALEPSNKHAVLGATDGLNGNTTLNLIGDALGSNVSFDLRAVLGLDIVSIVGSATTNTLTYTADSHTFNIGAEGYLLLNGVNFSSRMQSTDGTGSTSIQAYSDVSGGDIYFNLESDNGTDPSVRIIGDATSQSLTYTADTHTFNGDVILGYNKYVVLLTQSGTSDPTAVILGGNNIGSIVWARSGVGNYTATLTGAFPANKTFVLCGQPDNGALGSVRTNDNEIFFESKDSGAIASDNMLNSTAVEIRVYP